jgi:thioredoxin 1
MTSAHVTQVNDASFENEVVKSDKLVLIDFYADWCRPCKNLEPSVEKFAEENQANVKVVKIDIDKNPQLVEKFGVKSVPTLVTMKDGAAIYGAVGALPKSGIEKLVSETFRKLTAANDSKPVQPHAPRSDIKK